MTSFPKVRNHRPLIMGRRGAVAANHPVATQAGLDILRAGGNAVDATLATALALAVVEPHMSGLGGDGFYHVYDARTGQSRIYNGTGAAPQAATVEYYRKVGRIPIDGPLSVSIPGLVAGLSMMHARQGTKTWEYCFGPAIDAARSGFAVTHTYRHFAAETQARLKADRTGTRIFLGEGGAPPAIGDIIVQPELAATLEAIAKGGAEVFYHGPMAERIVKGLGQVGGLLTAADLASCQAEEVMPVVATYRGYEVRQTPPNSMGFALLEELRIAECFNLAAMGWGSADLVHTLVEAKKLAFLDRERHAADPRAYTAPLDHLLAPSHAASLAAKIDPLKAAYLPVSSSVAECDTTYFCVVDESGNAVSAIQSLNSAFGSGVMAGDTGILLNNRMAYWHLEDGHPNQLAPGKRVRHTMNAPVILKGGKLWCVVGTPGADKQVQVNLQVLVGMIDFDLDPQAAVEAARWASNQPGDEANYPHISEDSLILERGFGESVIAELRRRGHKVKIVGDLEGPCSVEAIRVYSNGTRVAGSDPRRDGWAAAY